MAEKKNPFRGNKAIWDWSDEVSKQIVTKALDLQKNYANADMPWCLATALAEELLNLRVRFENHVDAEVDLKTRARTKKLRQEFSSPSYIAELCRNRAGELDGKGWTGEAGVLREAAMIIEEDTK